jgi:WD40 repeat protein
MSNQKIKTLLAAIVAIIFLSSSAWAGIAEDTVWVRKTDQSSGFAKLKFFDNDTKFVGMGLNDVLFFDTETGTEFARIPIAHEVFFINNDTQFIQLNEEQTKFMIWSFPELVVVDSIVNDDRTITGDIILSNDERYLIATIEEKSVRTWDLQTNAILKTKEFIAQDDEKGKIEQSQFMNNSDFFLMIKGEEYITPQPSNELVKTGFLGRYSTQTLELIDTVDYFFESTPDAKESGEGKADYCLSNSDKYIAYTSYYFVERQCMVEVYDFVTKELICTTTPECGIAIFSPDDEYFVVYGNNFGLEIWKLETGEPVYRYSTGSIAPIALTNNMKYILVGNGYNLILVNAQYDYSGIEETEVTAEIYPNPTSNLINVETNPEIQYSVAIVDVLGNMHHQEEIMGIEVYTYDVSALPVGTYFLQLSSQVSNVTYKFIKE